MSKALVQYNRAKARIYPTTNGTLYGVNTFEPPYLVAHANVFAIMASLGVQVIRCGITWSSMQATVGGSIDWSEFDDIYALGLTYGITVIFVIETTPNLYNVQPHGFFPGLPTAAPSVLAIPPVTDPTYFPLWVSDQATWAGLAAARYPLVLWEWWNEWATPSGYWRENNVTANKPTISAWVTGYNASYAAIKAANPAATVAIGGLTGLTHYFGTNATYGLEAIRQLVQVYNVPFDAMSIHPYQGDMQFIDTSGDPAKDYYGPSAATGFANNFGDIWRVRELMMRLGKGKIPLWVSEWGSWSRATVGGAATQAKYVSETFNTLEKCHSYAAVGPNASPVTIATFYPLIDLSFAPTDTGLVGPSGNGPYTAYASGTAYQSFMASLPTVTHVVSRVVLVADSSVVVTHSTSVPTVTVLDQFGIPMTGQAVTFTSGTPAKATVASNGVATGVAAGTSNIKATCNGVDSNIVVLTVNAQVVTTVVVTPNPFSVAVGATQQLAAQSFDQLSTAMSDTFTWGSSATGQATVDGTGLVTGVAAGTPTITATSVAHPATSGTSAGTITSGASFDTTSYNATTGAGIFGSTGAAPQTFDTANQYASDNSTTPKFRANISSGLSTFSGSGGGTGNSSSLYNDGVCADLIVWQNSVQYSSQPAWKSRIVGQTTVGASAPKPILRTNQSALGSCQAGWLVVRRNYPTGWSSTGDATPGSAGATFNLGEAAGYKSGPFAGPGGGRAGLLNTLANWLEENVSGGIGGLTESGTGGTIVNEWTDGAWYHYAVHLEQLTGANGHQWLGATCWRHKVGDTHFTRLGYRRMQDSGTGSAQYWTNLSIFGENYNQARSTDLAVYDWGWAMWNDTSNSDPLGILAYEAGFTPDTPSISNATGTTSSTATFNVGVGRYSKTVIPVVDGVEITAQSYTLPAETPDVDPSTNSGYLTTLCAISRTVTGLSTGSHTISFNVYNGNGTISSNTGNKSVTI